MSTKLGSPKVRPVRSPSPERALELVHEVNAIFERRGWPEQQRDEAALRRLFRAWADSPDPSHHSFDALLEDFDRWIDEVYGGDLELACAITIYTSHLFLVWARREGLGRRCLGN